MILSYHIITLDVGCWEYYVDDENTFSIQQSDLLLCTEKGGVWSAKPCSWGEPDWYKPEHLTNLIRHQLQSHCLIIYQDKKHRYNTTLIY